MFGQRTRRSPKKIPCMIESIVAVDDGIWQVTFWQLDKDGNNEAHKSMLVNFANMLHLHVSDILSLEKMRSIALSGITRI